MGKIVHFCANSYFHGSYGGVPRFDYQIWLAFPGRIFFSEKHVKDLLVYLHNNRDAIVITDNHLSCHIPNHIKTFIVHHGCAKTTYDRNPTNGLHFFQYYTEPQKRMLQIRKPRTTKIISISKACTDDFKKYYGDLYTQFDRIDLLHPSELDENIFKQEFNSKPIVLGNFLGIKKGATLIPKLKEQIKDFHFEQLNVKLTDCTPKGIKEFNKRKQDIYVKSDIFLQISNSEGNSYATLDALLCGLPIVSSNVGLFYKDVPEDCFVKLEWQRNHEVDYVRDKLRFAWENKESLSKKAREWYMTHCRFECWCEKIQRIVNDAEKRNG